MLPGFGVAGVLGLAAIAAAMVLAMMGGAPTGGDVAQALAVLGASLVITAAVVYAWLRHIPNSGPFGRPLPARRHAQSDGYISALPRADLVGQDGVAVTDLRPAGTATDRAASGWTSSPKASTSRRAAPSGCCGAKGTVTWCASSADAARLLIRARSRRGRFDAQPGHGAGAGLHRASLLLVIFFQFIPFGLWITALFSGCRVSFFTLFGMRFRRVDPRGDRDPADQRSQGRASARTSTTSRGTTWRAATCSRVVNALISADKAGIALTYKQATAIDLAGRDVFEAVQVSVNPKVITTPKVAAMAKDGIQLLALARVTVRANINRLVGGAGEETILARVGEGIVSTIGSAASHKAVLENPDLISKTVLSKGLDAGTAFEILSIDIADVDVGKNIGAELQTDQAEADKRIAQAKAEERRALAVAMEQEFKAEAPEPARQGDRGGGPDPAGDGRGVPERQPRRHGLPALSESPGRHHHASVDRGAGRLAADARGAEPWISAGSSSSASSGCCST